MASQRLALDVHAAHQGDIGPVEIAVAQPLNIRVNESLLPGAGQERGNSHQTQRRLRRSLTQELERVLKAPKRVREFRVDQQGVHRPPL